VRLRSRQPVFSLEPLNVGECRVVVKVVNPRGGDQVGIVVDQTLIREQTVDRRWGTLAFPLSEPLRAGAVVRVRVNGSDSVNAGAVPALTAKVAATPGARAVSACEAESEFEDESPFSASVFFGGVVDTFAPDKVGNYQNPSAGRTEDAGDLWRRLRLSRARAVGQPPAILDQRRDVARRAQRRHRLPSIRSQRHAAGLRQGPEAH
jgi:hypothetical protein